MLLARALALVVALAACAWFAIGIRQDRDTTRAEAIISSQNPSPHQLGQASSLLRSAGWLNPDTQVDLLRADLDLLAQRRADGARIAESVVRSEPMNIRAWLVLAEVTPSAAQRDQAIKMIAQLEPSAAHRK